MPLGTSLFDEVELQRAKLSPAQLLPPFSGAWYEVHPKYLRQGTNETTTAAAVGSAVGWMQDLSGNGLHAIQATGTKQPILQQDSAGRFYLDFDGTDDNLQTASTFLIHDANGLSAQISAFSPVDTTTTGHLLSCSDSSKRHESRKNSAQPDLSVQNAAGAFFDAFGPSFAANDLLVMTTILGAGGIARARKNGVGGTPTTVTGTLVTGRSSALNVGCLSSAAAEFFKGKFYGGAWIAREPSVNELAAIERWFGVMVGVGI